MASIIQRMPPELRMGVTVTRNLYDKKFYIQWWADESFTHLVECKVDRKKQPLTKESAKLLVEEYEKLGRFVFASGPIPGNGGQHGVFAYSKVGPGEEVFKHQGWADNRVVSAYKSLFENDVQKIVASKPAEPEPEYPEDHAAFEAMRDVCLSADVVYHGDLPDPEPEDVEEVYTDQDQINEEEEPECSDLPE